MATTRILYKGKKELTMAQFEALTELDDAVDYDIFDFPNTAITNAQMTAALGYTRLFSAGEVFICADDGTYIKGHVYQVKVDGDVKSWEDTTPTSGASIDLKHSEIKNVDSDSLKEDAWLTSDTDATISIYHQNGTTQAGFTTSKNYVEMACVDTTSTTASNAKISISDDNVNIASQDSSGNKEAVSISPTETLFSNKPKVQTNGTKSEVVIKDDLAGYVPTQSELSSVALTWYINEHPDVSTIFEIDINFTSNNESFIRFKIPEDPVGGNPITYITSDSSKKMVYVFHQWQDNMGKDTSAYRTITFETAPTGELLTWLQANAVPQSSTTKTYAQITNENGSITFRVFENGDADIQNLSITKDGITVNGNPITAGSVENDSQLSDTSSNAVQNKVIKSALDGKLNKLAQGESNRIYARLEDEDGSLAYSYQENGSTIAQRSPSGTLAVEDPVTDKDAVNKSYFETALNTKQDGLIAGNKIVIDESNKISAVQNFIDLSGDSGELEDAQYNLIQADSTTILRISGVLYYMQASPINGSGDYTFISRMYNSDYGDYVVIVKTDKTWSLKLRLIVAPKDRGTAGQILQSNGTNTPEWVDNIAYQSYAPVVIITPDAATNGTLSQDDYDNLSAHDDVKIKLNNEYYILMDDENTPGIMSYIHEGWNGNSNQVKSINITKSTKAWTLVLGKNKYYRHYIQLTANGKAFYYDFSSTQQEFYTADTLPAMPDNIITAIQVVAGGYYSSVSGLIYRNSENALKIVAHGMYTDNGTSMSYLSVTGADATFVSDTVITQ